MSPAYLEMGHIANIVNVSYNIIDENIHVVCNPLAIEFSHLEMCQATQAGDNVLMLAHMY